MLEAALVFVPFFLCQITYYFSSGMVAWMPTAIIRGWGIPAAEYARTTGMVGLPCVVVGLILVGFVILAPNGIIGLVRGRR